MGKDLKGRELGKGIGQSKDKRYYARFTNRHGHRSKPYYSFNLKEVKDWLLKQRYEDKLGEDTIFHENVTIGEVYNLWIKEKANKIRPQSLSGNRRIYKQYIKNYEFYKVADITQNIVDDFMNALVKKDLSLGYMNSIKSIFSQILEYAIEKKCVLQILFQDINFQKKF